MSPVTQRIRLDQPVTYEITVQGRLADRWTSAFDAVAIEHIKIEDGTTAARLTIKVADQAALHGVLNQIRDLDLPLLAIEIIR
jgi:hypothetical protein